ncbi:hypothetical protein VYU27_010030, partial [Nannochloropsis oceanica]
MHQSQSSSQNHHHGQSKEEHKSDKDDRDSAALDGDDNHREDCIPAPASRRTTPGSGEEGGGATFSDERLATSIAFDLASLEPGLGKPCLPEEPLQPPLSTPQIPPPPTASDKEGETSKIIFKKAGEGVTAGTAEPATEAATGAAASRVDRDFLPWPSAVKKRPRGSCELCYQLKTQCDKKFPCGRCYRLNKPCRPPTESLELLYNPASSSSSSSSSAPLSSSSSPSSSPSSPSPLLDLVIERIDFKPMVHLYMQAFHGLREEGLVDRRRAIGLLRMWMNLGLLFGGNSDPTLGMFSQ